METYSARETTMRLAKDRIFRDRCCESVYRFDLVGSIEEFRGADRGGLMIV